jgi:hypothetical protein
MKAGMTKNSAGIGGKIEEVAFMGGFVAMTGGSQSQRQHERQYGKGAHADHAKAMKAIADAYDNDGDIDTPPFLDISQPKRVF